MEQIITKRCYLSNITVYDKEEIINLYTNYETRKFLGGPLSVSEAAKKFEHFIKNNETVFSVKRKESNTFIGSIDISPYYNTNFYELSYQFLPGYWGMGLAFEAVKACLDYCKVQLNLQELFAETQTKNISSRKLLEKLGYEMINEITRFHELQTVYHINLRNYRN